MARIDPLPRERLPWAGRLAHWVAGRWYPDLAKIVRVKARTPWLLVGEYAFEVSLLLSRQLDTKLKEMAAARASALIGCPG